jgi:hypothetical protein
LDESVALEWLTPRAALELFHHQKIVLFPPQWYLLHELSNYRKYRDVQSVYLPWAYKQAQPILPEHCAIVEEGSPGKGKQLSLLPGDAFHSWTKEEKTGKRRRFLLTIEDKKVTNIQLDVNINIPPTPSKL